MSISKDRANDSKTQSRRLKGNEPLLLGGNNCVWLLQSGSMAVFTVRLRDGEPEGARGYLFSAAAGDTLFDVRENAGEEGRGILAVALEPVELLPLSPGELEAATAGGDRAPVARIEGWAEKLGLAASQASRPAGHVELARPGEMSLAAGHRFQSRPGIVSWVRLRRGAACYMGFRDLVINQQSGILPVASGMWLEVREDAELVVLDIAAIREMDVLLGGLANLESLFLRFLELVDRQKQEEELARFQERGRLSRQMAQQTLGELATVAKPERQAFAREGSPLLAALRAVAGPLGIAIHPASASEAARDEFQAILAASRVRARRVVLAGHWWKKDNGPLLAFTEQGNRPVALLPVSPTRYEIFDPVSNTRARADARAALTLSLVAYSLCRPFPDKFARSVDLLKFSLKGQRKNLAMILLAGTTATLLGMLTPQATSVLIEQVIPDANRALLFQIGMGLLAAAIGAALFQLAQAFALMRVETGTSFAAQAGAWDRLLKLGPSFFRNYTTGDLQARVGAITAIRQRIGGTTLQALFTGLTSLLNLGLMFVYSVPLAVIASAIGLVAVIVTAMSGAFTLRLALLLQELEGHLFGLMVQLINAVPKLRIANAEERAFAQWGRLYSRQQKLQQGTRRIDDSTEVFNGVLPVVSSAVIFWFAAESFYGAGAMPGSGLSLGSFLAFNAAFGVFTTGATSLSNTLIDVIGVANLWKRAKPILDASPEVDSSKTHPGMLSGRLLLDHVTFRYRADGPLTLEDVTIRAEPGECIALVGPSGSGKSTILNLLLRFETPASGTVYFDGQDLAGLDVHAVRRQLGVVIQENKVMAGSIFENIVAGGLYTMEEAWEAARKAGFAEDIEAMPMGMHTMVSEGGTNISGGQRQRLLIARALVSKPGILIFDEATSALDNRTQAIVTESLNRLRVTRILVAHRLSTIRDADRIYVIEAGRVVQQGAFDELAREEGLFKQLMARQMV